ncbi:75_t:CDS:2 [Funneliformis mosseae]|uniref:75_t:CDS:1 n=1 Tax=Funneliformis mosseae TaxID=27381 RepID=A0A9N8VFM8_FUNMO|nr:75_t:CDS:2 [Funneliformis mosseae]
MYLSLIFMYCSLERSSSSSAVYSEYETLTQPDLLGHWFLDQQIFDAGQAYVMLSYCMDWSKMHIASFHPSAFITNMSMVEEYRRLEKKASTPLLL